MNDERIMDASLSPDLSQKKFKFTSQQGRSRRTELLSATRELLRELPPEEVTFALACERAGIPRASAYHFFPNIGALFLGLRLFHAEVLADALAEVDARRFRTWQDYLRCLISVGAQITREDPALMRLIYGMNGGVTETRDVGKSVDAKIARIVLERLEERFHVPVWPQREQSVAIAFAIIDSVFRLSFREHGEITNDLIREAGRAAVAYLRSYLPEHLEPREPLLEDSGN